MVFYLSFEPNTFEESKQNNLIAVSLWLLQSNLPFFRWESRGLKMPKFQTLNHWRSRSNRASRTTSSAKNRDASLMSSNGTLARPLQNFDNVNTCQNPGPTFSVWTKAKCSSCSDLASALVMDCYTTALPLSEVWNSSLEVLNDCIMRPSSLCPKIKKKKRWLLRINWENCNPYL